MILLAHIHDVHIMLHRGLVVDIQLWADFTKWTLSPWEQVYSRISKKHSGVKGGHDYLGSEKSC